MIVIADAFPVQTALPATLTLVGAGVVLVVKVFVAESVAVHVGVEDSAIETKVIVLEPPLLKLAELKLPEPEPHEEMVADDGEPEVPSVLAPLI